VTGLNPASWYSGGTCVVDVEHIAAGITDRRTNRIKGIMVTYDLRSIVFCNIPHPNGRSFCVVAAVILQCPKESRLQTNLHVEYHIITRAQRYYYFVGAATVQTTIPTYQHTNSTMAAAATASSSSSSLVSRRLYRALLKASQPFSGPNGKVLTCLLHRAGEEDEDWSSFLRGKHADSAPTNSKDTHNEPRHHVLFRRILRDCIGGTSGIRQMQFPTHVDSTQIQRVLKQEFRAAAAAYSDATTNCNETKSRIQVAFMALRELNKKLAWYETLQQSAPVVHPQQAASFVAPLPLYPSSEYLKAGAFLIAHPNMSGYFRRTVICILDHNNKDDNQRQEGNYGTYGLIVNRFCASTQFDQNLTLKQVMQLSPDVTSSLGGSFVRDGGPVHLAFQMLQSRSPEHETSSTHSDLGGQPLSMIPADDDGESAAVRADRAIYFRGDLMATAHAVATGVFDREDVSFFVGASRWDVGQLESEIERGYWIPARGPPDIAHTGMCEHAETVEKGQSRPKADLWLSMMCAMSDDNAKLAHLTYDADENDELGEACDDY
jgi:putative AlgH/UPF0301 family transcriptional regulator